VEYLPAYDAAIESLSSDRSMSDLAGHRVGAEDAEHFAGHWLGAWWPEHQPIEEILRPGLLEAFKQAREAELPLQTIVVEGNHEAFEVVVLRGMHQVTVLFLTPPAPHAGGHASHDITVIRRRDGQVVVE
jgi:hypothetical protein